jgi:hypothetical protein
MNLLARLGRWLGEPGRLRRRARGTADVHERASLLAQAAGLADDASIHLEAAVALAQAGRHTEAADSWRRAIQLRPLLIPDEAQLAALAPVLPQTMREVLDGLSRPQKSKRHWKLERRGSFNGEERWRIEQEVHWTFAELLPILRYVASAVAHTADAPGRLRIDCDRLERGGESDDRLLQMGEVIFTWDATRQITGVRVHE